MPAAPTLSEQKRAAILQAAISEFSQHGFQATSMDRLAAVAQVSKRTVYNHFASKDELFLAMVQHLIALLSNAISVRYQPDRPLKQQLSEIAAQEMALLTDADFILLSRTLMGEAIHSEQVALLVAQEIGKSASQLQAWIQAAREDGRLALDDVELAANQFLSLLKSSAFWPQLLMRRPALDAAQQQRCIDTSVRMFLSCYAPAELA
ncbi:TetR/AcrR family transcriptional regulator [Balneatrix alpica]|uniref:TetR/AcrR family transcriptional regulator n=1 Tax=Balneatrix alpica TaxID=75684 RepID=A0ABV5ZDM3_9GAMM|nr:TetR/AcrR family transcriptional regulator [Balneatrix alpica]